MAAVPFQRLRDALREKEHCFVCGTDNPITLGLTIDGDADRPILTGHWNPGDDHRGPPGVVHGGVQAALMDCMGTLTAAHHLARDGVDPIPMLVTSELHVHYRRPVALDHAAHLTAHVTHTEGQRITAEVELLGPDGVVSTEATVILHRTDEAWGPNAYLA